jgi:hypothetical protein
LTEPVPTSRPLPGNVVRLTRSYQGIELYFPPLRTPGPALALALFGGACFIPGLFAAIAVAPLAAAGAAGMLAIWLMSIFILPFIAFGVLFVVLAVYLVANSLRVMVTDSEIRSLRRVFGIALRERRVPRADVAALDAVAVMRYRWPRDDVPFYSLVVRTKSGAGLSMQDAYRTRRLAQFRNRNLTVAESLRGDELMEQVKAEIVRAARIERLTEKGGD